MLRLESESLEDVGSVDLVFDVIGADIGRRSLGLVRPGGTPVTIAGPPEAQPDAGRAVFFVVEPDPGQLGEIAQRVRDGRLRTIVGQVRPLEAAQAAFNSTARVIGKTIIELADPQGR
jgi:NADPH:quinone reductase-like Zn-dependent oxidoreductase